MKAQVPGQPEGTLAPFSFICYEDPNDKEVGIKCAQRAVEDMNEKEVDGHKLYVKEALKKADRESEKKKEQLRFKNSKKRCNLYVKNFPPTTTEEELRELFGKYGEIESIKMLPKEGEALYAFVCFKQPDAAALAKQQLNLQTFNNKLLYINNYELKEVRRIQQEDARDKADFQSYKKQSPAALSLDILNKPEIYQLIQYLMINLRSQQQNMRQGQNNRQGGQGMRGPRPQYNNPQGQMQRGPGGAPGAMQQQPMMQ
jgi:polyadenylate-binding protein